MTKLESMRNELEALQTDIEALSEIWEKLTANTNQDGDILIPEQDAIQVSIILGF